MSTCPSAIARPGYVANFVQEAMKGQLPLSVWGLCGQGVEQFGRRAALVSGLHHHLSFLEHVHEFDPVVFQKWRWTEIAVTLGLIFVASLRKE